MEKISNLMSIKNSIDKDIMKNLKSIKDGILIN